MSPYTYIIAYAACIVVFFAIDIAWLSGPAKSFYAEQLGDLLARDVRWGVAFVFYALYVAGIVMFAVRPGLISGSAMTAAFWGAAFGFFCYATYDLTNLATTRDWPVKMVLVDIPWGTFLTGATAGLGTWITLRLTA